MKRFFLIVLLAVLIEGAIFAVAIAALSLFHSRPAPAPAAKTIRVVEAVRVAGFNRTWLLVEDTTLLDGVLAGVKLEPVKGGD